MNVYKEHLRVCLRLCVVHRWHVRIAFLIYIIVPPFDHTSTMHAACCLHLLQSAPPAHVPDLPPPSLPSQEHLEELVTSKHGRRVLLQLLAPDSHRHFSPHILQMLHPLERTVKGGTGKAVTSIDGDEVSAGPLCTLCMLLAPNAAQPPAVHLMRLILAGHGCSLYP
jgi:hypothetical protein